MFTCIWIGFDASLGAEESQADFTWAVQLVRSRAFTGPYEGRGPKDRAAQLAFISVLPCDCKQRKKKSA